MPSKLDQLMGGSISLTEAEEILTRLGLAKLADGTWDVPSFRADLQRHIDLVEEIARVHGLANVPSRFLGAFVPSSPVDAAYDADMVLRRRLAALGMYECQTIKLISDAPNGRRPAAAPAAGRRRHPRETPAQRGPRGHAPEHRARTRRLRREKRPPTGEIPAVLRNGPRLPQCRRRQGQGPGKRKPRHPSIRRHRARRLEPGRPPRRSLRSQGPRQRAVPNHTIRFAPRERDGFALGCDIKADDQNIGVFARLVAVPRARAGFQLAGLRRRAGSGKTPQAPQAASSTSRTSRSSPAPPATPRWNSPPPCRTPDIENVLDKARRAACSSPSSASTSSPIPPA